MNEPKVNITVMPGAQMNGYVKEQHNYFGNVLQMNGTEAERKAPAEKHPVRKSQRRVAPISHRLRSHKNHANP